MVVIYYVHGSGARVLMLYLQTLVTLCAFERGGIGRPMASLSFIGFPRSGCCRCGALDTAWEIDQSSSLAYCQGLYGRRGCAFRLMFVSIVDFRRAWPSRRGVTIGLRLALSLSLYLRVRGLLRVVEPRRSPRGVDSAKTRKVSAIVCS